MLCYVMYVCMYVCVYIYICVHIHMYIYIYTHIYVHTHTQALARRAEEVLGLPRGGIDTFDYNDYI